MTSVRVPPVPLLVAFSVLGPVTIHMILPSLPFLQDAFGTDFATAQLLVSFFVVAFGAGQLLVGPLADLIGRRMVLCGGMALYTLASVLCALAPNIETLIGLRAVQGLAACTGTVLARAIIREFYDLPASTRILGYLAMGISIGPIVAPTAGGLLFQAAGWRMPFWTLALMGLANTALAVALLPRLPGTAGGGLRGLAGDIGRLVRDRLFLVAWLTVCFNAGCVFTFIANASLISNMAFDLSPAAFGAWFGLGAVGYIAGNFTAGRLASRFSDMDVLGMGVVAVAVLAALMVAVLATGIQTPLLVFGLFSLIMAASGLVMPNAFAASMAAVPAAAGSASGFVGFAQYALGAVFATVASHLVETRHEPLWLGVVMLGAALCGAIVAVMMIRRRSR